MTGLINMVINICYVLISILIRVVGFCSMLFMSLLGKSNSYTEIESVTIGASFVIKIWIVQNLQHVYSKKYSRQFWIRYEIYTLL